MPLDPVQSRAALLLWSISWIPGLFLLAWRLARWLPARQWWRAAGEGVVIAALPLAAWAAYALSDAAAQAQAQPRLAPSVWRLAGAIAQVAVPYLVAAAFAGWRQRRRVATAIGPGPWWVAAVLAVASIPFLTPGLFMAQLMLVFGG